MKKIFTSIIILLATVQAFGQSTATTDHPSNSDAALGSDTMITIAFPVLFILSLVFMLIALIRYFLDYRLKSKLIDRGMSEQLSAYILNKSAGEKQQEAMKLVFLFLGIGTGLTGTYLTAPVHLHSLAIMAFCVGLSYLAYFFYLRRQTT